MPQGGFGDERYIFPLYFPNEDVITFTTSKLQPCVQLAVMRRGFRVVQNRASKEQGRVGLSLFSLIECIFCLQKCQEENLSARMSFQMSMRCLHKAMSHNVLQICDGRDFYHKCSCGAQNCLRSTKPLLLQMCCHAFVLSFLSFLFHLYNYLSFCPTSFNISQSVISLFKWKHFVQNRFYDTSIDK